MERTVCDCQKCRSFCRRPGYCVPDDVPAIAEYLGMSEADLRKNYLTAGRGITFARYYTLGLRRGQQAEPALYHVSTIVPKAYNGWCTFFDTRTGHCQIHPVAPFACRMFDDHISPEEFETRRQAGLRLILEDGTHARPLPNPTMPT